MRRLTRLALALSAMVVAACDSGSSGAVDAIERDVSDGSDAIERDVSDGPDVIERDISDGSDALERDIAMDPSDAIERDVSDAPDALERDMAMDPSDAIERDIAMDPSDVIERDVAADTHGGDADARDAGGVDADPDADDTDGAGLPDVESVLAELRADAEGTMRRYSHLAGWPLPVAGGRLYVSLDPDLTLVAGAHDDWTGTPMIADSGFRYLVLPSVPDAGYKLTDGGERWEDDPWSRSYRYDDNGRMSLVDPAGAHLDRHHDVSGDGLLPRTLRVWVPAEPHDRVLYAHDGQNLFDPSAFFGGWRLQDSVPDGVLVVGIDNTAERFDDYTHVADVVSGLPVGGNADAYAAFVQGTVRPMIRERYGEPGPVGLIGSSLGGLVSFYVAHLYPGEYDFAASLSGTMGWGSIGLDGETIIDLHAGAGHRGTALYLDSGGGADACLDTDADGIEDDAPTNTDAYCENVQLRDLLESLGYAFGIDLWHWWEPGAPHNEAAWAARVFRPLEIFAGLE